MSDKTTKLLLLLIAIGLLLNAAGSFYNAIVTPAYAADSTVRLDGGTIQVRLDQPVRVDLDDNVKVTLDRMSITDTIRISIPDEVKVRNQ
ncbi:MAG TPA: hypothetical protein PKW95_16870 [bacterium]|nr:hypothetical protein [bacterium]